MLPLLETIALPTSVNNTEKVPYKMIKSQHDLAGLFKLLKEIFR